MSEEHKYDVEISDKTQSGVSGSEKGSDADNLTKKKFSLLDGLMSRYSTLLEQSELLKNFPICEVENGFYVRLHNPTRLVVKEFVPLEVETTENKYLLGPGLHAIIGTFESGKSTMINHLSGGRVFYANEVFSRENEFGTSNVSMEQNLVEIFSYLNDEFEKESFAFVDSLRCVFSFNKRGYAKGGLAIGPFDFFDNLDKLLKRVNRGLVCVIPIDDDRLEHREMFFSMMSIRTSSCFMPYAAGNLLQYSIRMDMLTKKRITRRSENLFASLKL